MKVVHILASGGFGGIETLLREYSSRSRLDNIFVFVWDGGPVYEEMKNNGIPCILLGAPTGKFLESVKRILEVCETIGPDAVITHHSSPQFKVALAYLGLFRPKIKTAAYVHANAQDIARNGNGIKSAVNKALQKLGLNSADHVIAISGSVKESLIREFHTRKEKISVIYNGVDTSSFAKLPETCHQPLQMIYVGRLIREKGVQTTIAALESLKGKMAFCFSIVGDGPYCETLKAMVRQRGLADQVRFLGSRRDIPALLEGADIFIHMPEWEEGFGITVVEAMAAGKVCVVADSGALPEIVTDGVNGFLVEKGNAQALARKIQEIAGKLASEEMQKIRTNAVKRAEDFSIQRYSEALDALVEGTADRRSLGGKDHS